MGASTDAAFAALHSEPKDERQSRSKILYLLAEAVVKLDAEEILRSFSAGKNSTRRQDLRGRRLRRRRGRQH
jgi:hypothetical protein